MHGNHGSDQRRWVIDSPEIDSLIIFMPDRNSITGFFPPISPILSDILNPASSCLEPAKSD